MTNCDKEVIRESLRTFLIEYQDIVRRGDRAGFRRVFHPEVRISYPSEDKHSQPMPWD